MADATLKMILLGQDRGASKAIKGVGDAAGTTEKKTGRLGTSFSKAGAVAGKVLAGGLLLAGAAALKMTKAAATDEAAASKLAQTLRKGAGATDTQVASTERWITAQGKALGVSDDDLRPALGRLAVATHDVGKAQSLASLAMDVSAGSGKSLESVTAALAKGVNGNVGGLGRLGVATKNADGSTKSLNQITKDLAKTYDGAASKAADTSAGKQKILAVQFGELQEKIGTGLLPVFQQLTDAGLKMIDWMSKHATTVKVVVGVVGTLVTVLWLVSKAMTAVNIVMSLNPVGAVIVAIAALVAVLILAYKKSETFRNIVNGALKAVGKAATWLWEKAFKPALQWIVKGFGWILIGIGKMLSALGRIPGFGWAKTAGDKMQAAGRKAQGLADKIAGIHDKHVQVTADTGGARTDLQSLNHLLNRVTRTRRVRVNLDSPGVYNPNQNYAVGARHYAGGTALVGERGPELVNLPRGSGVMTAQQTARTMAGHNGSGDLGTLHVVVSSDTGVVLEKKLARLKRRRGGKLEFEFA